jgi:hypothetical protein
MSARQKEGVLAGGTLYGDNRRVWRLSRVKSTADELNASCETTFMTEHLLLPRGGRFRR